MSESAGFNTGMQQVANCMQLSLHNKSGLQGGAQFMSALWSGLCSLLNIQLSPTTAYHPQSNGFHRWLMDGGLATGTTTFHG
jgi:hypothetical protein